MTSAEARGLEPHAPCGDARAAFKAALAPSQFRFRVAEKRGLDPHTPSGVRTAFETGSAPSRFLLRECRSGPLRYRSGLSAFSEQRYHLISLGAVVRVVGRGRQRARTSHVAVRIAFQTISAPCGFTFRE